jgi:hypothetical protein
MRLISATVAIRRSPWRSPPLALAFHLIAEPVQLLREPADPRSSGAVELPRRPRHGLQPNPTGDDPLEKHYERRPSRGWRQPWRTAPARLDASQERTCDDHTDLPVGRPPAGAFLIAGEERCESFRMRRASSPRHFGRPDPGDQGRSGAPGGARAVPPGKTHMQRMICARASAIVAAGLIAGDLGERAVQSARAARALARRPTSSTRSGRSDRRADGGCELARPETVRRERWEKGGDPDGQPSIYRVIPRPFDRGWSPFPLRTCRRGRASKVIPGSPPRAASSSHARRPGE